MNKLGLVFSPIEHQKWFARIKRNKEVTSMCMVLCMSSASIYITLPLNQEQNDTPVS